MRLTDAVIVDPRTRAWRKAVTMEASIERRLAYHMKNSSKEIGAGHISRAREIMAACRREADSETPGREINSSLSSRAILKIPVKEVMAYIFTHLRPPGPAQHDDFTQELVEMMNRLGKEQRAAQHRFNINAEVAYRVTQGWYVVFNTLTVRPGAYYQVFNKHSKEFKNYVRNYQREIDEAEYGTRNAPRGTECNHVYFACVEEGGEGGRLHIHVLHLSRALPRGSNDPNRGRSQPTHRELWRLKRLWTHGNSTPIAARFSPKDAYGKIGWRWPIDKATGDAKVITSPLQLANYMSKYINKGYTSCKRAKLLWRVRKSQSLGKAILDELTSPLSKEALLLLATDETMKIKLNHQRIPPNLLRQAALRRYLNEQHTTPSRDYDLHNLAKQCMPRPSLLQSSRTSMTVTPSFNLLNSIPTLTLATLDEDISKELCAEINLSAQQIDKKYYRRSLYPFGKTSTADYIHPTASFSL